MDKQIYLICKKRGIEKMGKLNNKDIEYMLRKIMPELYRIQSEHNACMKRMAEMLPVCTVNESEVTYKVSKRGVDKP